MSWTRRGSAHSSGQAHSSSQTHSSGQGQSWSQAYGRCQTSSRSNSCRSDDHKRRRGLIIIVIIISRPIAWARSRGWLSLGWARENLNRDICLARSRHRVTKFVPHTEGKRSIDDRTINRPERGKDSRNRNDFVGSQAIQTQTIQHVIPAQLTSDNTSRSIDRRWWRDGLPEKQVS